MKTRTRNKLPVRDTMGDKANDFPLGYEMPAMSYLRDAYQSAKAEGLLDGRGKGDTVTTRYEGIGTIVMDPSRNFTFTFDAKYATAKGYGASVDGRL
jgi:hypothetical protein